MTVVCVWIAAPGTSFCTAVEMVVALGRLLITMTGVDAAAGALGAAVVLAGLAEAGALATTGVGLAGLAGLAEAAGALTAAVVLAGLVETTGALATTGVVLAGLVEAAGALTAAVVLAGLVETDGVLATTGVGLAGLAGLAEATGALATTGAGLAEATGAETPVVLCAGDDETAGVLDGALLLGAAGSAPEAALTALASALPNCAIDPLRVPVAEIAPVDCAGPATDGDVTALAGATGELDAGLDAGPGDASAAAAVLAPCAAGDATTLGMPCAFMTCTSCASEPETVIVG